MINKKLTWEELHNSFRGEWVELIDYEWEWDKKFPIWVIVRHHSTDRDLLNDMIASGDEIDDAIVIYLGAASSSVACYEAAV